MILISGLPTSSCNVHDCLLRVVKCCLDLLYPFLYRPTAVHSFGPFLSAPVVVVCHRRLLLPIPSTSWSTDPKKPRFWTIIVLYEQRTLTLNCIPEHPFTYIILCLRTFSLSIIIITHKKLLYSVTFAWKKGSSAISSEALKIVHDVRKMTSSFFIAFRGCKSAPLRKKKP